MDLSPATDVRPASGLLPSAAAHAIAGAVAAAVWAAQQPLDKRVFRHGYDDVELLGKAFVREGSPAWRPAGWAMHLANGAAFGVAFWTLRSWLAPRAPRLAAHPVLLAQLMAQAENFGLFPLAAIVDRHHPASRRGELPRIWGSQRALAQATWRHALFGFVLGRLVARSRRR